MPNPSSSQIQTTNNTFNEAWSCICPIHNIYGELEGQNHNVFAVQIFLSLHFHPLITLEAIKYKDRVSIWSKHKVNSTEYNLNTNSLFLSIKKAFERMSNRCPKKITSPTSFLIPNPYYYFLIDFSWLLHTLMLLFLGGLYTTFPAFFYPSSVLANKLF